MSRVIYIGGGVKADFLGHHEAFVVAAASHTFEGVNLGPASSSGVLVIAAHMVGTSDTISSVSVNGTPATEAIQAASTSTSAGLWYITGQSGVGDVQLSIGNDAQRWRAALWKLRGLSEVSPRDTDAGIDAGGAYNIPLSLDAPGGSVAICYAAGSGVPITDMVFAGVEEDFNDTQNFVNHGGGRVLVASAATITPSVAGSANATARFIGAIWR